MKYDFSAVEQKWQKKWEDEGVFHAQDNSDKPKFYGLVEFPYPSGAGMHVGHIKAYSGLEVVSRKRRMQGYNVLFPIGFDAYGLPTENYAIKTGIHPRKVTDMNIEKFSSQLKKVGFSFDWNRVVDTTEESYYKWTQWIFLKMFERVLFSVTKLLLTTVLHVRLFFQMKTHRAVNVIFATVILFRNPRTFGIFVLLNMQTSFLKVLKRLIIFLISSFSRLTGLVNQQVLS